MRDIAPANLLCAFAMLLLILLLPGCAQWSIQQVIVNPAGPLGGAASVNPVVLVAPAVGSPGGFQAVETVVQFHREPGFSGVIHTIVTLYLYPPGQNGHFSVIHFFPVPAGRSRGEAVIFHAFCKRIEQANGQASVELFVQTEAGSGGSATITGITEAHTTAGVDVASRTDTANPNDWPVQARGFRVPISCLRDDPAAPRPPPLPSPPLTPREKCMSECLEARDACMADVATRGGPRPQQCVASLRACQLRCSP
jgi:hypothetical protein